MKTWHPGLKVLVVVLCFFMAFPCSNIFAAAAKATTQVKHKPPGYYLPGFRIILEAEIKDEAGVQVARCYFKTKKEQNFVFTDMAPKGNPTYQATLPAPWVNSESIDYVFVAVNEDKKVVRTQVFSIKEKETEQAAAWREAGEVQELRLDAPQEVLEKYEAVKNDLKKEFSNKLPEWQAAESLEELVVLTEFEEASAQLSGFFDDMVVTTVPSTSKYGVLATGLYTEEEIAAIGGKAATASATGASTAGTIGATAGGIGMGTLAIGAAVVAGAAVAIGSSSDSDDAVAPAAGGGGGGGAQLFATVLPPNGNSIPCCDLELIPISGPPVAVTVEHPGLGTRTWDGTFPIGYASIGAGLGRLTLTSAVAGGTFQIHFPTDGGRATLTVNGNVGDYIPFQTQ